MANMVRIQNAITEEDHLLNLGEPNDAFLLQHLYSGDVITEVYPADLLDSAPEARGFEMADDLVQCQNCGTIQDLAEADEWVSCVLCAHLMTDDVEV